MNAVAAARSLSTAALRQQRVIFFVDKYYWPLNIQPQVTYLHMHIYDVFDSQRDTRAYRRQIFAFGHRFTNTVLLTVAFYM